MVRGRVAYLIKLYDKYLECLARWVLKNLKAMDSEKSIEFDHVSFRLPDGRTLLSDLTLEVHRGETLVLLEKRFRQNHDNETDQPSDRSYGRASESGWQIHFGME